MRRLLLLVGGLFLLLGLGSVAQAQGTVTNVTVTPNPSPVNTTVTAPNVTQVTVGFGATTGSPQPGTEWKVKGQPSYSWSSSAGTPNPSTGSETSVSSSYNMPGTYKIDATCTVTYTVVKINDNTITSTITGRGSASAPVNIGVVWDIGLAVGQYYSTDGKTLLTNGRLTAPQDQTKTPAVPATVYTFPGKKLPCSVETATSLAHKSYPLDNTSHQDYVANPVPSTGYVWTCSGGQFFTGNDAKGNPQYASTVANPSATWVAPSSSQYCSVSCTITDVPPGVVSPDTGTRGPKSTIVGCNITVLSAGLAVRRTGAVKPDPNNPGQTLPADYGSTATVAAGGASADVRIAVLLPNSTPAPGGITVQDDLPVMTGYKGVSTDAGISIPNNVTDANGFLYGTYTSSDMVTATRPDYLPSGVTLSVSPSVTIQGMGGGQSASVVQRWDDDNIWSLDDYFSYDVDTNEVDFYPAFDDGSNHVAITGHSLSFQITNLDVYVWNDKNQNYDYEQGVTPDQFPAFASLAWFAPSTFSDSGGGIYTSFLHAHYDVNNIVDYVYFIPVDNGINFTY